MKNKNKRTWKDLPWDIYAILAVINILLFVVWVPEIDDFLVSSEVVSCDIYEVQTGSTECKTILYCDEYDVKLTIKDKWLNCWAEQHLGEEIDIMVNKYSNFYGRVKYKPMITGFCRDTVKVEKGPSSALW